MEGQVCKTIMSESERLITTMCRKRTELFLRAMTAAIMVQIRFMAELNEGVFINACLGINTARRSYKKGQTRRPIYQFNKGGVDAHAIITCI